MSQQTLLIDEDNLAAAYQQHIQPFWARDVIQGSFTSHDQLKIAYAYALNPQAIGSVVISSGRIEAYLKYKEVMFDLYRAGYSVFIIDHRGQGMSGRMTANPHMGYVKDFADYVADFELFIQQVVLPHSSGPLMLLCHSMGSAIGAMYVLAFPRRFNKVVFCAPMFGIRPALPGWLSNLLIGTHLAWGKLLGRQYAYFAGQGDYVDSEFALNRLTHSQARYQQFRHEYMTNPHIQLGGVTGHWLYAAAKAMDKIEQQAADFPIPALIIQAGNDQIVDNARQRRVVNNMPQASIQIIPNAKHEVLMEQDQYRQPAMQALLAFFSAR